MKHEELIEQLRALGNDEQTRTRRVRISAAWLALHMPDVIAAIEANSPRADVDSSIEDALDRWWHEDHFGENCKDHWSESCGGECHSQNCVDTAFRDGYRAALQVKRTGIHVYLSTACIHNLHKNCNRFCKYGDPAEPCICECHKETK